MHACNARASERPRAYRMQDARSRALLEQRLGLKLALGGLARMLRQSVSHGIKVLAVTTLLAVGHGVPQRQQGHPKPNDRAHQPHNQRHHDATKTKRPHHPKFASIKKPHRPHDGVTALTPDNYETWIQDAIQGKKTAFVRWMASDNPIDCSWFAHGMLHTGPHGADAKDDRPVMPHDRHGGGDEFDPCRVLEKHTQSWNEVVDNHADDPDVVFGQVVIEDFPDILKKVRDLMPGAVYHGKHHDHFEVDGIGTGDDGEGVGYGAPEPEYEYNDDGVPLDKDGNALDKELVSANVLPPRRHDLASAHHSPHRLALSANFGSDP